MPTLALPKTLPHATYRSLFCDGLLRQGVKQLYLIHRNRYKEAAKLRRQRNMAQMKEQNNIPEKELNETEITNQSHAEFKIVVIRMLRELRVWPQHKARNEGHTK